MTRQRKTPAMPSGNSDPPATAPAVAIGVGFCGKLQSHGDFVQRRLPPAVVRQWEGWLEAVISASRESLGEDWLAIYLSSPIWRFAASPGCCGEQAIAGVLMPSLDRVGRHYPLTIMAVLDKKISTVAVALWSAAWFREMEDVALAALCDDFDFDAFDARLAAAAPPPAPEYDNAVGRASRARLSGLSCAELLASSLAALAETTSLRYSFWWTLDSKEKIKEYFVFHGLPTDNDFVNLIQESEDA